MLKAIFFDFDGTLADTTPGIVATMSATYRQLGKPVPTEDAMIHTIGLPLIDALKIAGNLTDEESVKARDTYTDLFMTYEIGNIGMFPHVAESLVNFSSKGLRLAIVTSRNIESLEVILDKYGLKKYFEVLITNNDHLTPKPAPDMVLALLQRMDLKAEEAVVIGDTTFDIEMGNRAGCRTVAVTYGNHSREQLLTAHPTHVIDAFQELEGVIATMD